VYVADDVQLKRQVAVKVLHRGYNADAAFLRRFRAEAQLAARLHHHNIVVVYDWGEDEVPYLVLELLEGGSLRSMLDEGVRLTPAQAAHMGMQICAGLEYAHSRGLVHRDIKPANLLFDEHGIVRIADFGLARALAEASYTEPTGAVVGTARYASPEQASGHSLDGRSDLYSLALVLHEAVTGEVPFASDTAVSTLAARVGTDLQANSSMGALGAVIERAGKSDPSQRYSDAGTMFKALADIAAALPKPGPLTLVPEEGLVVDPNPTNVVITPTNLFDQETELEGDDIEVDMSPDAVSQRFHKENKMANLFKQQNIVGWVILAMAIVVLASGMFTINALSANNISVPNVTGFQKDVASAQLATTGLRVTFSQKFSDDPVGTVIASSPAAGDFVDSDGTVRLILSKGPKPISVTDVMAKGLSPLDARAALEKEGFIVIERREFSETVPKDSLIGTDPKTNAKLAPESTISLIISDGPQPVPVPSISGKTFEQASAIISGAGFSPARRDDFSDTVPAGSIIGTDPAAGTEIQKGATVSIVVSKGPELVGVPNLVGQTVEAASGRLEELGLVADVRDYKAGRRVLAQTPAGGQVKKGTKVTLFL
ncbi:MAG TPA: PASTA domain-containing protein, partial [Acidimicrobiia bacterium]|nr:PASTA domain-containing protein [Acidimicrobiia bacterium]